MIVVLVNPCHEVRFSRKDLLRPPTGYREEEEKRYYEDGRPQLRRCHKRLTINKWGRWAGKLYHGFLRPSTADSQRREDLVGDPCSHRKDLPIMVQLS